MSQLIFLTHPEVHIDPSKEITSWSLSPIGRDRVTLFSRSDILKNVEAIFTSSENKATQTANILANQLHLNYVQFPGLEEIDRSATGYLPLQQFEDTVSKFFAAPSESINGWETANHAQQRVVNAFEQIIAITPNQNILISSHGGVGALLLSHLKNEPISQKFDQSSLGNYFVIEKESQKVLSPWQKI